MLSRLKASLLLLAMMGCTVVNADDSIAKSSNGHVPHRTNTALVMNKNMYEIQQDTSTIQFRVDSPFGDIWGNFGDFEGSFFVLTNGMHNQSAVVDINTDSLHTDSSFIETILKSEMFFDVERCSSMRFVGSSLEWFNDSKGVLKGELTINNVTRQIAFYLELNVTRQIAFYLELVTPDIGNEYSERITIKASTTIKRSRFGIHTLSPAVSDNVNIFMNIDALKQNTAVSMM